MKCPSCGASNDDGKAFCGDCGAAMGVTPVRSVKPAIPRPGPVVVPQPASPLLSERTKKRLKIGAIVIAVILIVGSVLGYLYYYQPVRGVGTVSSTTIDAGQSVHFGFTPSQGIPPYQYIWNFGDEGVSAEKTPLHSYNSPGTYIPTVTVTDTASKTTTWTTTIIVNPRPSVVGTVSPSTGVWSLNASFAVQGQGGTLNYSYFWQFGDGNSSDTQNPMYHYSAVGTYTATVVVRDGVGMTASWVVKIIVYPAHVSGSGSVSTTTIDPGQGVQFGFIPSPGVAPYRYSWDFGDGGVSAEENPLHTYSSPGSYVSSVTVSDSAGNLTTWNTTIVVNPPPSVVGTVTPSVGASSLNASFTAQGHGGMPGYSYFWLFGDGNSSDTQNATHHYSTGVYAATVIATDGAGMTASWSVNISVNLPLMTGIEAVYTGPGWREAFYCTPSQGVPPYSYYWQFGDGESSTLQNPSHIYGTGTYSISLIVTDSVGETVEAHTVISMG